MTLLKAILIPAAFCFLVFFSSAPFSSCTKTEIIHDTTTVHDTTGCYDLKDGLIAYYNFNGGNLNDSSGHNNHIILNNGAVKTIDRFGNPNNAYLFNGSSSYMQVKNSSSLSPANITMMAIIKLNGFYQGEYHVNQIFKKGFRDQSLGIYGLRVLPQTGDCCTLVDTTKEMLYGYYGDFNSTLSVYDTSYNVHTNKWVTEIVTFDGFEAKIYVDGVLKRTTTGSPIYTPNSDDFFIGRAENPQFPYYFNGVIDEIRVYNKALCEDAVKQLSNLKQ